MKNKIIKFRSVEGVTGLKQIWGYVCFKAGLSFRGWLVLQPPQAHMYANEMTHTLAGRS